MEEGYNLQITNNFKFRLQLDHEPPPSGPTKTINCTDPFEQNKVKVHRTPFNKIKPKCTSAVLLVGLLI